jgi:type I restriction enzyme, R subunit
LNEWRPSNNPTEDDVKRRFITPAIVKKWDIHNQIFENHYFTDGRVHVRKDNVWREKGKKADYILCCRPDRMLAVVEAKDGAHSLSDGMQQAIGYAEILDIPFAYSSNGTAFLERDMLKGTEREIAMDNFPGPEELWARLTGTKQITEVQEKALLTPYHPGSKEPRYYQQVAINRTIEAIANGQRRILLVMATGTGKTFTASQIVHILKSAGLKKKILYLADRNVLIDQPMNGDFKPFAKVSNKISGRQIDTAFEVYFALYQQLTGGANLEPFRAVERTFFDLVIVDECHRGSAAENSQWREVLEYFSEATQIGMTATPKETEDVSNSDYFGDPIYTYSLKQGIEDGFLAPYRVISIDIDKDIDGWRPYPGQRDYYGREIEDREYSRNDFDNKIIMPDRTDLVA